jgi:DNA-binding MarR family transcriptional regulator
MTVKPARHPEPHLELERFLPYRLNVLAEAVSQALAQIYRHRYGIAVPEWRVLATLGQYEQMTAKQVGIHSRMHKTKVSRAVAGLEARGLLARTANADDRREAFLTLTSAGRRAYRDLVPRVLEFVGRLLAELDPAERQILENLMLRLQARAESLAAELGR